MLESKLQKPYIQPQQRPTSVLTASTKKIPVSSIVSTSTPMQSANTNNGTVDEYSSLKLKASTVLPTDNGAFLPVLKKVDKQNLLAVCCMLLYINVKSLGDSALVQWNSLQYHCCGPFCRIRFFTSEAVTYV
jgi:hypothetical protein